MRNMRFLVSLFVAAGPAPGVLGCSEVPPDVTLTSADAGTMDAGLASPVDDGGATALPDVAPVGPPMTGLKVVGNVIHNGQDQTVVLHGVNRSGTEYECVQGGSIFDGFSDELSVQQIALWKANAVRVPLNESCWLSINGAPRSASGGNYVNAITAYVSLLHKYNIVPILELHWVGPGSDLALRQQPFPDKDHAKDFWASVTMAFRDDSGVVFEPYNEPYADSSTNTSTTAAWNCWKNGCPAVNEAVPRGSPAVTYASAGMQDLVDAIRGAESGVTHVVLLGGMQYSDDLSNWLQYEPTDPMGNLGAAWHVYNSNACKSEACWNGAPAAVAQSVPLVATEIGEDDCKDALITPLMSWLDSHGSSYLAWSWNAGTRCLPATFSPDAGYSAGSPYSLIVDYATATPVAETASGTASSYAQTYHDHLAMFSN